VTAIPQLRQYRRHTNRHKKGTVRTWQAQLRCAGPWLHRGVTRIQKGDI
jgi:hypothetical protein